ncbi:stevor PIR protein, putative [Plasmodium reichenowi]|uniref:Stevor PIR protein, putative n=1 Tax=Plasmodium reichenowi TaxID=5854 RepID=A0A2P9DSX8_PLARE|nr:stevor PIR protein, putative [Plasmodium reichenowi]
MKIYYLKTLLFIFLINTLILPQYENCENSHYNKSLITNNTQITIIKSRLLAQTQNHNPHYHNDPELKEIIDKLNEEAIKKYQQTHDPYKQLKELVEKKGTKLTGGNGAEPMSMTEKELFETYEEMFGEENHIMLKSGMYTNDDEKSSTCECANNNNTDLRKRKGKDKYLKHLKHRCIGGICSCSLGSALLIYIGLAFAKTAALGALAAYEKTSTCSSVFTITNIFNAVTLESTLKATTGCAVGASDMAGTAVGYATATMFPYSIAIYVLIAIIVLLIILYIWLYRRRKRSWKHECKKHLCK